MHKKSDFCSNCLHLMLFLILISVLALPGQNHPPARGLCSLQSAAQALRLQPDFGKLPLYFIENQGQIDRQVSDTREARIKRSISHRLG